MQRFRGVIRFGVLFEQVASFSFDENIFVFNIEQRRLEITREKHCIFNETHWSTEGVLLIALPATGVYDALKVYNPKNSPKPTENRVSPSVIDIDVL